MLTITVNDRPIDVAAIVDRGRVLLPMRATFTALGASVRYDPEGRIIIARNSAHAMRLQIGSVDAIVDGHHVALDVPPRVIATRTLRHAQGRLYVPLRFVAQAMGAVVGYDEKANLVSVVSNASGVPAARLRGTNVIALSPSPESIVSSAYPTISASLATGNASRGEVTLTIDGQDVTALASFDGTTITYMPRIGLSRGRHTVMFYGRTPAREAFSATWSFSTSLQAPADAPSMQSYNYRFYASGPITYYPGDWMHFVLLAPPGGSAVLQLCGGNQYALWNGGSGAMYEANFPVPNGYWMPACTVTATYVGWNGRRYYVPVPVVVGIFTGNNPIAPTPRPTGAPRPLPSVPRRQEPTPAPIHTLRPMPIVTRAPIPLPLPTAKPPVTLPATPVPVPAHTAPAHPIPHPRPRPDATLSPAR